MPLFLRILDEYILVKIKDISFSLNGGSKNIISKFLLNLLNEFKIIEEKKYGISKIIFGNYF